MECMKRAAFLLTLILIARTANAGEIIRQTKGMWGKLATINQCELLERSVSLCVLREKEDNKFSSVFVSPGAGRWQRLMWNFPRGCAPGEPTAIELRELADGAVLAEMRMPLLRNEERVGGFTVQTMQLPDVPGFTFFRLVSDPAEVKMNGIYLGVALLPAAGRFRVLHLAWPGGSAATGGKVEWFSTKPSFNIVAWFSQGGGQDSMSEYLVFDSESLKSVYGVRWKQGDDRAVLNLVPVGAELVFALGSNKTDSGQAVAVPRFLKSEGADVYEKMKAINWSPRVDWGPLQKELSALEKLIDKDSEPELQKALAEMKAEIQAAVAGQGREGVSQLKIKLEALRKKVYSSGLEGLLD